LPFRFLILGICVLVIILPNNPGRQPVPNRDSGVFLYIGQRILEGQVPYRDAWDHKPPLIFFINALGLFLVRDSWWGVWLLELIFLTGTVFLAFSLLERNLNRTAAIFGSVVFLLGYITFGLAEGGNFTEEYGLVFQFLALGLFATAELKDHWGIYGFLIGVTAGICFLLKQSLVGIWLAIIIYLVISRLQTRQWKKLVIELALVLAGAAAVLLIPLVYFGINQALGDFWQAAFLYNFRYASATFASRLEALKNGLQLTFFSGIIVIIAISWIAGWVFVLRHKEEAIGLDRGSRALLIVALLSLPLEFVLASLPGRLESHYFLAWLPTFTLLAGFFPALWWGFVRKKKQNLLGMWILLLAMSLFPLLVLAKQGSSLIQSTPSNSVRLSEYIQKTTSPDDTVLIWGAEAAVNFVTRRISPSRYVYQYPLLKPGFHSPAMAAEFLGDVRDARPRLIIDASPWNPNWPALTTDLSAFDLTGLADFIDLHYEVDNNFKDSNLVIYRLSP
jgi:4-amino-4-deoxy-L-arabinose transferase-like glycosyltransferase